MHVLGFSCAYSSPLKGNCKATTHQSGVFFGGTLDLKNPFGLILGFTDRKPTEDIQSGFVDGLGSVVKNNTGTSSHSRASGGSSLGSQLH